ncbi:PAS domain S-box protein, partial [Umezakia ovalisporum]|uniref:PAS domain S-box protein n=1 Tax=Umezakia ovalisporum TaxID=75695 RepID=UPI0039C6853D
MALTNEFNEPIEIQCMGQDITDLQNAEKELKKFKTISDQANIGTAITTLEGVITYANHYFEKLHGSEPGELIGKNIADLH